MSRAQWLGAGSALGCVAPDHRLWRFDLGHSSRDLTAGEGGRALCAKHRILALDHQIWATDFHRIQRYLCLRRSPPLTSISRRLGPPNESILAAKSSSRRALQNPVGVVAGVRRQGAAPPRFLVRDHQTLTGDILLIRAPFELVLAPKSLFFQALSIHVSIAKF